MNDAADSGGVGGEDGPVAVLEHGVENQPAVAGVSKQSFQLSVAGLSD
jgi:hypothetical protein